MRDRRQTRLSRFCEHIIEGCWLVALAATPLFFNLYSSRVFEPDKTALLRSIALIMGLAWIVLVWEQLTSRAPSIHGRPNIRSVRRLWTSVPVLPLALLLLIDHAFATVISVEPRTSLWGSYPRLQGLYTTAVYVGVFFSMLSLMRRREQLERVVTTVLVVSLPVSLYGIIQYFGTDPLSWTGDVMERVASSMGNPIFVAGFLILTVPPAVYRLLVSGRSAARQEHIGMKRILVIGCVVSLAFQAASWQAGPTAGTASAFITTGTWLAVAFLLAKPVIPFLRISNYTVLLSTQLVCVFFTQSRGPWLGLIVGLFLFAILWTLLLRRWKRTMAVSGIGLAAAVVLIAVNLPATTSTFLSDVPYANRLGQLLETQTGSARVRVLIWEGVEEVLFVDPQRTLVGYGPETLHLVYPKHYSPELGRIERRDAIPDRAHNETFDVLVTTGLIGFAVYVLFFICLFYCGMKWMGLLATSKQRTTFLALSAGGGGGMVLLCRLIDGAWRFGGLALATGVIGGVLVYVCGYAFVIKRNRLGTSTDYPLRLLMAALLSAIAAHFVEIQFGIAVVATRTTFWTYGALLVVCGRLYQQRSMRLPEAIATSSHSDTGATLSPGVVVTTIRSLSRPRLRRRVLASSLVVGFILVTIVYDFVVPGVDLLQNPSILWLLSFTWLFAGLIIISETWPADHSMQELSSWMSTMGIYAALTGTLTAAYMALQMLMLRSGDDLVRILFTYHGAVLLIVAVFGYAMGMRDPRNQRKLGRSGPARIPSCRIPAFLHIRRLMRIIASVVLIAVVVGVAYVTNVKAIHADIYFKRAVQYHETRQFDQAIGFYGRALSLAPKQDVYYLFISRSLLEKAESSSDPDSLLQDAEQMLLKALALSPYNPDHHGNLARLYRMWARHATDPQERRGRLEQALTYSDDALALSPNKPSLWNDWGLTSLLIGDTTAALRAYDHSLVLDDSFYETHLLVGNLYSLRKEWHAAERSFLNALELNPDLPQIRHSLELIEAPTHGHENANPTEDAK